jgi:four helix bundle protein
MLFKLKTLVMGKFKDLQVWRDAVDFAEAIYQITNRPAFSRDFGFKNQLQRAVVSISANIAEGDDRGTVKEAIYHFHVAKASSAEVISHLNIAFRIGYLDKTTFLEMEDRAEKIRASLKNLIKYRTQNTRT